MSKRVNIEKKIVENEVDHMTIQQEAHRKIDNMSENGIKFVLEIINSLQELTALDFKSTSQDEKKASYDWGSESDADSLMRRVESVNTEKKGDIVDTIDVSALDRMSKAEKRELFFKSAGNMRIDAQAIYDLRERSMV